MSNKQIFIAEKIVFSYKTYIQPMVRIRTHPDLFGQIRNRVSGTKSWSSEEKKHIYF
jgi:hypothetical protein